MNSMRSTTRRRGGTGALSLTRQTSQDPHTGPHADTLNTQSFADGSTSQTPKPKKGKTPRPRPTHFIAIPLNTNPTVLNRVSSFQNALLKYSNPPQGNEKNRIRGLDPSLVIDPRRFHFTLGVMSLEDLTPSNAEAESIPDEGILATTNDTKSPILDSNPSRPARTVESALTLLRSLKPALTQIVSGGEASKTPPVLDDRQSEAPPLRIALDNIDTMEPVAPPGIGAKGKRSGDGRVATQGSEPKGRVGMAREDKGGRTGLGDSDLGMTALEIAEDEGHPIEEIWTNVLYLAPSFAGVEGEKLRRISDLVYQTFKRAGYLTDTRPLKLHCTVLNASKRRPSRLRGTPFSYSDILKSGTTNFLSPITNTSPPDAPVGKTPTAKIPTESQSTATTASTSNSRRKATAPPPVPINLGAGVSVEEIGLWIMGSRGPNNEYVSCGGVGLR